MFFLICGMVFNHNITFLQSICISRFDAINLQIGMWTTPSPPITEILLLKRLRSSPLILKKYLVRLTFQTFFRFFFEFFQKKTLKIYPAYFPAYLLFFGIPMTVLPALVRLFCPYNSPRLSDKNSAIVGETDYNKP